MPTLTITRSVLAYQTFPLDKIPLISPHFPIFCNFLEKPLFATKSLFNFKFSSIGCCFNLLDFTFQSSFLNFPLISFTGSPLKDLKSLNFVLTVLDFVS
ncbi:hypothetical protein L6452_16215 [Arctium lappa]|uniref:Uncharacterized protein n=1 Tax=Arctium lappa TaxID=4217 RepID=A0ACB9C017_ARCLA|nr:hypothetical protein L6452_16215 [Arctium lappa]